MKNRGILCRCKHECDADHGIEYLKSWNIPYVYTEVRNAAKVVAVERNESNPPGLRLVFQTSWSVQSEIFHEDTSSSMTKARVLKTMFSYISLAAARACLCHGPVPPALASSLLLQTPVKMSVCYLNQIGQFRLTSRQVLIFLVFGTEPILQQTTAGHGFLVRVVVEIMQSLNINVRFQSGAE